MKKFRTLIMAVCAIVLSACNISIESELVPVSVPCDTETEFSIEATIADLNVSPLSKAGAMPVLRLTWNAGDEISVINLTTGKALGGDLVAQESGTTTKFNGTLKGALTAGDKLGFIYPSQHYTAETDFTVASIDLSAQNGTVNEDKLVMTSQSVYGGSSLSVNQVFDFSVSYVLVSLADLPAGEAVQRITLSNISNVVNLSIDPKTSDFQTTNDEGTITITPANMQIYGNGTNSFFIKIPHSSAVESRELRVLVDDFERSAKFASSEIVANYFMDITIAGFKEALKVEDAATEAYLLEKYDLNKDGVLSKEECLAIEELSINSSSLITETGIKFMPNLKKLTVDGNPVTPGTKASAGTSTSGAREVNFSDNPRLEELSLANTDDIVGLDLSMNTVLKTVSVEQVPVAEMALPATETLISITVAETDLTYLDISGNQNLETLKCSDSSGEKFDAIILAEKQNINKIANVTLPTNNYVKVVTNNGDNVIKYVSTDGNIVTPYNNLNQFGSVKLLSNTYDNNEGTIVFDGNLDTIPTNAFALCANLKQVTIPQTVTTINASAFSRCALESVTIPDNVTAVAGGAFQGCVNLRSFYGKFASADNRMLIDNYGNLKAFAPAGITNLTIPSEVTYISNSALASCPELTNVTIPETVTGIGSLAFSGCTGLTEITIPESVKSIGSYAFPSTISKFTFNSTTPPSVSSGALGNHPDLAIYVPLRAMLDYKAYWSNYADAIRPIGENNVIAYKSTDGNVVTPYDAAAFGVNIISNTYENGNGVITFDDDVTSIGDYSFKNCKSLTAVVIPNSVKEIGRYAFNNCGNLGFINLHSAIETIGEGAFEDCNLSSVEIPNSVISLGDGAFSGNKNLEGFSGKFTSSDNRSLIVDGILKSVAPKGLTAYTIPNAVTEIGAYAFENCSELTSVSIPSSVRYIGHMAFDGCTNLSSVNIPDSVTKIENWAFSGCESLTTVTIPSSVTSLGQWVFQNCTNLETLEIPNSVTRFGQPLLSSCPNLEIISGGYSSEDNRCLVVKGQLLAFAPAGLTSYILPDSVTTITQYVMMGCTDLKFVEIPSSVTLIQSMAFLSCSQLETVVCRATTPPQIKNAVFGGTSSNLKIYVPEASVDAYKAAEGWSKYADAIYPISENNVILYTSTDGNVVTPRETTPFNSSVFGANIVYNTYKDGQGKIVFDGVISQIGYAAFSDCATLKSVTIPSTVTSIGQYAFQYCYDLSSVEIPNSVTEIGINAFGDCSSLTSIDIPSSVITIQKEAFYGCSSLTSVDIPNTVINMESGVFSKCLNLESFTGKFASADNRCLVVDGELNSFAPARLTSYDIPDFVTSIGDAAFTGCSNLTSVEIPSSVASIGKRAFYGCTGLTSVYFNSTTPPTLGENAFRYYDYNDSEYKILPNVTLYIPSSSSGAYKAASSWDIYYKNIRTH